MHKKYKIYFARFTHARYVGSLLDGRALELTQTTQFIA